MGWSETSTCRSWWIYVELEAFWIQFGALFGSMIHSECFQKHSLYSWVGTLWLHRFRKFFDLSEVPECNWEIVGSSISILDMALYTCDVGAACVIAFWRYLRYLGIVKTIPTYLIWGTPALWGQCLRTLFEILRYCRGNAYVSSLNSGYLIWRSTLWLVHLWPTADVWLLQWANYFSAMTVYGWTLAEKPNRSFEYVRYFDTVRTVSTYLIVFYYQIFDLENYVVTFVFAT